MHRGNTSKRSKSGAAEHFRYFRFPNPHQLLTFRYPSTTSLADHNHTLRFSIPSPNRALYKVDLRAQQSTVMSNYASGSSTSAGASAGAGAASTSDDPYAPFYYWDASANNWAFDYNSYYATYGYPAEYYTQDGASTSAAGAYAGYPTAADNPYYYAQQQQSSSSSAAPAAAQSDTFVDPFTSKPTTSSQAAKDEDRYDEQGRLIPGKLRKGETRPTVLRRAAGKIWEDQTLLDWDPTHKRLFIGDLAMTSRTKRSLLLLTDILPSHVLV